MVQARNLGFPRIGVNRELKKALEGYWKGDNTRQSLEASGAALRLRHWKLQQEQGIDMPVSGDFTFYDHVLNTLTMAGAVPARYGFNGGKVDLETFFAMARGQQKDGKDVVAMEMTKWFDTNYHYIVPEFEKDQQFSLSATWVIDEYKEARTAGITTRPVILGPVTFLLLGKTRDESFSALELLPKLLPVYKEVISQLKDAGADEVQIDEPYLVMDLCDNARAAYKQAYDELSGALPIFLTTYFGGLKDNAELAFSLPVDGLHIDLVRAPEQLDAALDLAGDKLLSLGVVDGRNIWRADLAKATATVKKAVEKLGSDKVAVAPSCSLLHVPVDLDVETKLDAELKSWLAFAKQKLAEVSIIARAINEGEDAVAMELDENKAAMASRATSSRIHNKEVKDRLASVTEDMARRASPFDVRIQKQNEKYKLPLLPTTTIGSFPQTKEIRAKRALFRKGEISREEYDAFLEKETISTMKFQDEIGIDVPVHGEFERNDMVEYFGEKLNGYAFTKNGWVQSYGSRCVKPPVIFGDVSRSEPMTVRWSQFAQQHTDKPVKGMLTGPVTILQWSFVRDDQPRRETCDQIALAILDEVRDLEAAGVTIIQIDEPALREGLPLRRDDWREYLDWAVRSFRLSSSMVDDTTQIHTHMCYSEFNDIIDSIAALDADVISIETSRSAMELLDAFVQFKYPNQIGPGVYDIHSPRIPAREEMETLLRKALNVLVAEQVWVNPDCGLKTRGWKEVEPALKGMVDAARNLRAELEEARKSA